MSVQSKISIFTFGLLTVLCNITLAADVFSYSQLSLPVQVRMNRPWYQVINSQQEWATFFDNNIGNIYSNVSDYRTLSDVDFNTYTMIIGGLGGRTGSDLLVNMVTNASDGIYVKAAEIQPGSNCDVAQVVTYPTRAILIPKTIKPIIFYVERDYYLCK